jgi:hypothetical protein
MVGRMRAVLLSAAMVSVAVTGCSSARTLLWPFGHHHAPLTGASLSALVPTPAGFILDRSASSDSGAREATPVHGSSGTSGISCASWWSGTGYFGPGTVAYTIRNYTGPERITLQIDVNAYPAGTGASVYAMSVGLQRRCLHFSYLDKDGVRYVVSARIGPSAGIGDHSQEVDATETAPEGAVFTTQTTFVSVGDALVVANETGSPDAPVSRAAVPLTAIVDGLRSAGY